MAHQGDAANDFSSQEARLLALRLDILHEDVLNMRTDMRTLTAAITKLSLVEERQNQAAQTMERAFTVLDAHTTEISSLKQDRASNNKTTAWVDRVQWLVFGAVVMFVLKHVGLLGGSGG